jgi:hypothetical protein
MERKQKGRVRRSRSFNDLIGRDINNFSDESSLAEHVNHPEEEKVDPFQWTRVIKVNFGMPPLTFSF